MNDKSLTFKLKCRMKELETLRRKLKGFGQCAGLPPKLVLKINLALDELFTNLVSYGCAERTNHFVRFSIALKGDDLLIKMEDTGSAFNPLSSAPPDLTCCMTERTIGGIGIHLVRHLMDHLAYRRCKNANILEMRKCLAKEIDTLQATQNDPEPPVIKETSKDRPEKE